MATLTERQQRFVVTELACFETPKEVVESVQERFGVDDVYRQQVQYYDPTVGKQEPAEKWRALFHEAREQYIEDTARHGIAHRTYRLGKLQEMLRKAMRMGNLPLAADILEQAAKEEGEKFTNKQLLEHSGPEGGPIETADRTPQQVEEKLREMLEAGEIDDSDLETLERIGHLVPPSPPGDGSSNGHP